jgi:hypothetical protein
VPQIGPLHVSHRAFAWGILSQLYGRGATSLPASKERPLLPACNLSLPFLKLSANTFPDPLRTNNSSLCLATFSRPAGDIVVSSRRKLLPFRLYPLRRATLPVPAAPYILPTQAAARS